MTGSPAGRSSARGAARRLVILRHAKSAWPDGVPDQQRPLAGRGRRDGPAVGRWLRDHVGAIDLVVCSPAVRARQTWELAAAELAALPRVRHDETLYGASADELLEVVRTLPRTARTAVIVGHNPGLEDLAELLTGRSVPLKTSGIAVLVDPASWPDVSPGGCTLAAVGTPRG